MNAAARSVVRHGVARGYEMVGIYGGAEGLVNNDLLPVRALRDEGDKNAV